MTSLLSTELCRALTDEFRFWRYFEAGQRPDREGGVSARLFKASTGLPPHQYVIGRRIERAKQLLRDDDHSLAQVAARVGFWDQGYFTRHFERLVGVTPGRFR
jgi:methylphosphotriester-DNA--protein-cysteine methyltransferase